MVSMIPPFCSGVKMEDLEKIKSLVRLAYPSVPQLSTDALARRMQDRQPPLLLVDVRSPEEFAVSHLKGAVNLRSAREIAAAKKSHEHSTLILYCAVGFRSSRMAHRLARKGLPGVLNLEGSIFQWANEGRPIYQGDTLAYKVHPSGKRFGGLLKAGLASAS
jgi:rhodanese-related sulfurtransferase